MYTCTFVKYLWKDIDKKRLYRTLEKQITLPFIPSIGIEVGEGEWFSGKIERVFWDNSKKLFTIKVMDVVPKDGLSAELLIDVATKQGWQIRE